MTNSLLALEQSLTRRKSKAEGMTVPNYAQLQQQIEVVQGKRVGQPSNNLRVLENRLLGNAPINTPNAQREIQRLDHGQAPLASAIPAPPQQLPVTTSITAAQSVAADYTPEFSAPNTGRFQVEPFSEPTSPEQLFQPAEAVLQPEQNTPNQQASAPSRLAAAPNQTQAVAPPAAETPPLTKPSPQPALLDDSDNWLNQVQPQKISQSSRNALDSSAALARDDFERDMAAILGQTPPQPTAAPQTPTPQSQAQASSQTAPARGDNVPPPHPNHDIFDQMGLGMQYANSFDLGEVNLQERFDSFDRELETQKPRANASQSMSDSFVSPMELDEFDLMAELAEIDEEYPDLEKNKPQNAAKNRQPAESPDQEPTDQRLLQEQQPNPVPESHTNNEPAADKQIANNNQTEPKAGEDHE